MPFKRPANPRQASSESSSRLEPNTSDAGRPFKLLEVEGSAQIFASIKLYIIQAKIDDASLVELFDLAENHGACLVENIEQADVVITAISMRRRLERHLSWDLARTKAVVTPAWLQNSVVEGRVLPFEQYVALQDLRGKNINNCITCDKMPCKCGDTEISRSNLWAAPSPTNTTHDGSSSKVIVSPRHPALPANYSASISRLDHTSKYACQRASPLICPNQALAAELDIIKRSRALEGEDISALSYSRAISVIKAFPQPITSIYQISKLIYIGPKTTALIQEYLDRGSISEARSIAASGRFASLTAFSSIYGIGTKTARKLYALGLRTVEDLEVHYKMDSGKNEGQLTEIESSENFSDEGEVSLGDAWIRIALRLRRELELKIPRDEVEEMGRVVMRTLDQLQPGCISTITGGYRRGKPESNDVDIVITHPDPDKSKGLCKALVRHLHAQGMVTHVAHMYGSRAHNPLKRSHWDNLEKALAIFILPPTSPLYKGIRRRLDLIFAQPEAYWCAVVGWTGSTMFNRDLRQWASDKANMRFDNSGITRRHDSKPFYPQSEKEVFDLLSLEWVDPTLRNADL